MVNRKDDIYYDKVNYHFGALFNTRTGNVSALCYKRPRAINLSRGQSWTIVEEQVTCPKCRKLLKERANDPTWPD